MKINRKELGWFLSNIRGKNKGEELTDEKLIDELASFMEVNPSCIDLEGVSHPGRFSYSTVGYGVMSLLGEKYRMGRIEIFDAEDGSGYATSEGTYCMPFIAANQFEDFIEALETELPIQISIGSVDWCRNECAKALGFNNAEELSGPEKAKEYRRRQNDEYAREKGYKDWDDLIDKKNLRIT